MKKLGLGALLVNGLAAAVLGLAGPASADVSHNSWINDVQQHATAPQVDTSVHQSR
ncbi:MULTISPECIES: hypothetical protein [unclassified Mycolicibacterium]|uniref:hypothetical protein n=1 Tax=unclassified Mycolicibacterium TaxID=2636767 RepID=UPI0014136326|nr:MULTISPECIES: hypothetical protein [unclassified Mycolicibacterium]